MQSRSLPPINSFSKPHQSASVDYGSPSINLKARKQASFSLLQRYRNFKGNISSSKLNQRRQPTTSNKVKYYSTPDKRLSTQSLSVNQSADFNPYLERSDKYAWRAADTQESYNFKQKQRSCSNDSPQLIKVQNPHYISMRPLKTLKTEDARTEQSTGTLLTVQEQESIFRSLEGDPIFRSQ